MRELADSTGGKAYYNNNDLPRGVRLALDDSREVYVLTYYPKDIVEDGAYHQIRVQSARQGVQLRFRHGYYATAAEEESAADRLAGVVQSPLDKSEIGLQASLEPGTNENGEITVVVHVDPADLVLARAGERWTGALRLQAVQFGALGQRYEGVAQAVQLDLRPETYQRTMAEGLRLEVRLKREPAAVAVRVGVVEEHGGHVGSVSVPLPRRAAQPLPAR
jgi:hypothetical protein